MADSSRHAAYLVPETVYAVTPNNPVFKRIRHNALTLGVQRGSLQSEELRPDRQLADFRLGAVSVQGDLSTELSLGAFDDILEAALCGTWGKKASLGGSAISAASADNSFNDVGLGFVTAGFQVGDIVISTLFTNPTNNGRFKVSAVNAGKLTITHVDGVSPTGIVTEAAGGVRAIVTNESFLKCGVTRRSFSVMRQFTDIVASGTGEPFHLFKGVEFNTLAINVKSTAIVSAKFGITGCEGAPPSNTAPVGSTYVEPSSNPPMDGFTGALIEGGVAIGVVTELSINLANGLEVRNVVGSKLTIRPSIAMSLLTGSFSVYFENSTMLKKFLNETSSSIKIDLIGLNGGFYTLEIPRIKYTGAQPDVSGQGSIMLQMPFQAVYDPTPGVLTNFIIRSNPA